MPEGKITRIPPGKEFFFIDNDCWCHKSSVRFEPQEGDIVTYDKEKQPDGKFRAQRVKFVRNANNIHSGMNDEQSSGVTTGSLSEYLVELRRGYFNDEGFLKEEFSIKYPKFLATLFIRNPDKNKVSQIRGFFDHCQILSGTFKFNRQFAYVQAELSKLDSQITYALNRENISKEFAEFFRENLEIAKKDEKNFKDGFLPHFQALIANYLKK